MRKDMSTLKTVVIFRVFKSNNQVIALFPYETWNDAGDVASYMHVGQHSGANYARCVQSSRPATPEEYASLKLELENYPEPYTLDVRKRRTEEKNE
jgi:hypothetical protein